MKIFVNGEAAEHRPGLTISELMEFHRLAAATALVELNGVALSRREWERKSLKENDRVEILQVAAGG